MTNSVNDIDLDLEFCGELSFTCPRCGRRQTVNFEGSFLEIHCESNSCGKGRARYWFELTASGWYKTEWDIPLDDPA